MFKTKRKVYGFSNDELIVFSIAVCQKSRSFFFRGEGIIISFIKSVLIVRRNIHVTVEQVFISNGYLYAATACKNREHIILECSQILCLLIKYCMF